MIYWPDPVETVTLALFYGDLIVRGHAMDVWGIVAVIAIRLARVVLPKPPEMRDIPSQEIQALREQIDQLKNDVSRVSLIVGVKAG